MLRRSQRYSRDRLARAARRGPRGSRWSHGWRLSRRRRSVASHGERDLGTCAGERSSRLHADAGRAAGDDRAFAAEVYALDDVGGGGRCTEGRCDRTGGGSHELDPPTSSALEVKSNAGDGDHPSSCSEMTRACASALRSCCSWCIALANRPHPGPSFAEPAPAPDSTEGPALWQVTRRVRPPSELHSLRHLGRTVTTLRGLLGPLRSPAMRRINPIPLVHLGASGWVEVSTVQKMEGLGMSKLEGTSHNPGREPD